LESCGAAVPQFGISRATDYEIFVSNHFLGFTH
jgi:hypothetical protein